MATLIAETKWHDNPRPVAAYASSFEDGLVASPYYNDQRDVVVHKHFVTASPIVDIVPSATIDVAGPAPLVEFTLNGIWPQFTSLTILLTLTGTAVGNYDEVLFSPGLEDPEQAAAGVAQAINEHPELTATSDGRKVIVSALAPVTAITITTLTVN